MKSPLRLVRWAFLPSVYCLFAVALLAQSPSAPPIPLRTPPVSSTPRPLPAPSVGFAVAPPANLVATINYPGSGSAQARNAGSHFQLAEIRPQEAVDIQVQFPINLASSSCGAQALDGGKVSFKQKEATIGLDGTISLRFQAGDKPGLYRVQLTGRGGSSTLQFWVENPRNPKANPPVLHRPK